LSQTSGRRSRTLMVSDPRSPAMAKADVSNLMRLAAPPPSTPAKCASPEDQVEDITLKQSKIVLRSGSKWLICCRDIPGATVKPMQQHDDGDRIASAATMRRFQLRLTGLAGVLPALLMMAGGIAYPAQAEDPSSTPIVSACRPTADLAAFGGPLPGAQAGINNGADFTKAAATNLALGNYEGAIRQFDRAINLNPSNPNFYLGRGMARMRRD
jgi:TPR repeat